MVSGPCHTRAMTETHREPNERQPSGPAPGSSPAPAAEAVPATLRLVRRSVGATPAVFWSYALDGPVVTLAGGIVGGRSSTRTKEYDIPEAARKAAAALLAKKVDAGCFTDGVEAEPRALDEVRDEIRVPGVSEEPDDRVLVLPPGTRVPHALWMDHRQGLSRVDEDDDPIVGILVRGDLHIDGCLVDREDDHGPFLEVHGDLTARSIATGGSQIHVGGNLTTTDLVGVCDHGGVRVDGDLTARTVATEHAVEVEGATTAHRYDGWGAKVHALIAGLRPVFLRYA